MSSARVWKYLTMGAAVAGLVVLLGVATVGATRLVAGNLVVDASVNFAPKALPRLHDAPIKVWGYEKLRTKDGSIPPPTTHLAFEFSDDGHLETRGLPTCPRTKLVATTTAQAIRSCGDAIVGRGFASAVVAFPEQAPIPASTSLLFFNAPPIEGDPAVIVHGYLTVPVPTAYLDTIRIRRINKGSLGYMAEGDLSRIAGGYGSVPYFRFRLGRKWRYKGETLSYISAHCAVPNRPRLLAHAETRFADGTTVEGSLLASCEVR